MIDVHLDLQGEPSPRCAMLLFSNPHYRDLLIGSPRTPIAVAVSALAIDSALKTIQLWDLLPDIQNRGGTVLMQVPRTLELLATHILQPCALSCQLGDGPTSVYVCRGTLPSLSGPLRRKP